MNAPLLDSPGPAETRCELNTLNPATLEPAGRVTVASASEVRQAVARARDAQPAWAALSFKERAGYILRAKELVRQREVEICNVITNETGKPRIESLAMEVLPVANLMDYFARQAGRILRDERIRVSVFINKKSLVRHEPLGVVGIIAPWNYPFSIPAGSVVMALMAGNAVVLKPSEFASRSGLKIAEIFKSAGLPEGVLEVVTGDGNTGAALVEAAIDKITFTGSVSTGRKIAEVAARRLMPCLLELGGKDAMIVCHDAPLERAVNGALWGAFTNCGQACASVERLYVVESISDRFIKAVVEKTKTLRVGPDDQADIGPLIHENQLRVVTEQVNDAVAKGATVLTGGRRIERLKGYFYEPTVLVGVNDSMRVMREETFGPVLPMVVVKDDEEAVRLANRSNFGLLASVWTTDTKRGRAMAGRIQAGSVLLNDVIYTHGAPETPWFGIKESGLGVNHSAHGLREFTRLKHINWDTLPLKTNPWWFPYSAQKERNFKFLLKALHQWGLKRWI